jgi:phospholipid N-methyltransferase
VRAVQVPVGQRRAFRAAVCTQCHTLIISERQIVRAAMRPSFPSPDAFQEIHAVSFLSDSLLLLRRLLSRPLEVAALAPSSAALARAMVADLRLSPGASILELGPGTGALTSAIDEVLRDVPGARYLGIERDPVFADHLRTRYPHLRFVEADARDLKRVCMGEEFTRVDAVICAVPLILLPTSTRRQILEDCAFLLSPQGEFRALSYLHSWPRRCAHELRAGVRETFISARTRGPIWLNIPPAVILSGCRNARSCAKPSV